MGGGFLFGHHDLLESSYTPNVKSMIQEGKDPKEYLIEACRPLCTHWQEKLKRCEVKLMSLEHADPEKSCMYPLRDWVTCIDGCVQPKIIANLVGHEAGWFS